MSRPGDAHTASYSMGTVVSYPGINRPGREVNHSPPFSAEVKNEWSCDSTPALCLHGVDRDNLTFCRVVGSRLRTMGRQQTVLGR